jgi:hypothetical protein
MPRRARFLAVGLLAVGAAVTAAPALAEDAAEPTTLACGDHDTVVDALRSRFGEHAVSRGLDTAGRLIQVFASADTGTWTIIATRADGTSCVMAVGRHFEQRPMNPGDEAAFAEEPRRRG